MRCFVFVQKTAGRHQCYSSFVACQAHGPLRPLLRHPDGLNSGKSILQLALRDRPTADVSMIPTSFIEEIAVPYVDEEDLLIEDLI